MKQVLLLLVVVFTSDVNCEGFYKETEFGQNNIKMVVPTTLDELKKALCNNVVQDQCTDKEIRNIVIRQLFDFKNFEGTETGDGCFYTSDPEKCTETGQNGQIKLDINNQCQDLKKSATKVSYDVAGLHGLYVGSNKVIQCQSYGTQATELCGIVGKGLRLKNVFNVQITKLFIGDINPQIIGGGVGIELSNVRNVLIERNLFRNIGDYMVVSHEGSSQAVSINSNTFDGSTKFSASCDSNTNWMWQFNGEGDIISMDNNYVNNAFGPVLRIQTPNNAKSHYHLSSNKFSTIETHKNGMIDLQSTYSSIFAEKNCFPAGINMIYENKGAISMPNNCVDIKNCREILGKISSCNLGAPFQGLTQNKNAMFDHKEVKEKIIREQITKDMAEKDWSYLERKEKPKEDPATQTVTPQKQVSQQVAGGQSINQQAVDQSSVVGQVVSQQLSTDQVAGGQSINQQTVDQSSVVGQVISQQLSTDPQSNHHQSADVQPTLAVGTLDSNDWAKLENKVLSEDKKESKTLLQGILNLPKKVLETLKLIIDKIFNKN